MNVFWINRRHLLCLACVIIFLFIVQWILFTKPDKWYLSEAVCHQPQQILNDMLVLAEKIHLVLEANDIAHMLCYGSLWGVLRYNDILPWDNDVDFCIWSDDVEEIEEAYLHKLFKENGIRLDYDFRKGSYRATYGQAKADIVVFELSEDFSMMLRLGLTHKYSSQRDAFPSQLIAAPLPTAELQGKKFPVPRKGIEIQKFLYPDSWQKEVKPPNC